TVNFITVQVQGLGERVVGTELLQLSEGLGQQIGVHQAHVGGGCPVATECTAFGFGFTRIGSVFDIGDIVALASVLDVALNIWGFDGLLGWRTPVFLNQARTDYSREQRGIENAGYGEDREAPAGGVHGGDDEPGDQKGGDGQDGRRRNHGVRIRV